MENASKALLISGGILIAIVILGMFLSMFNSISSTKQEAAKKVEMDQLNEFNAQFEAYNKKIMYGVDVITLANKIAENNKKYTSSDFKIELEVEGVIVTSGEQLLSETDFEKRLFKCTRTDYNDIGRICKIIIVQK